MNVFGWLRRFHVCDTEGPADIEDPYCADLGAHGFRCTRPIGHAGRHGYAGMFWDGPTPRPAGFGVDDPLAAAIREASKHPHCRVICYVSTDPNFREHKQYDLRAWHLDKTTDAFRTEWVDYDEDRLKWPTRAAWDAATADGLADAADREAEFVFVIDLYVQCSYPLKNNAIALSDCCGTSATGAVESANGSLYWRCTEHQGWLKPGVRGEIHSLAPNPQHPANKRERMRPSGCGTAEQRAKARAEHHAAERGTRISGMAGIVKLHRVLVNPDTGNARCNGTLRSCRRVFADLDAWAVHVAELVDNALTTAPAPRTPRVVSVLGEAEKDAVWASQEGDPHVWRNGMWRIPGKGWCPWADNAHNDGAVCHAPFTEVLDHPDTPAVVQRSDRGTTQ